MARHAEREFLGRIAYEATQAHMGRTWPRARHADWNGVPEISKEYYRVAAEAVLEQVLARNALVDVPPAGPDVNSPAYLAAQADIARELAAPPPPSFTCPRCRLVSHEPNDVRLRYCWACDAMWPFEPAGGG